MLDGATAHREEIFTAITPVTVTQFDGAGGAADEEHLQKRNGLCSTPSST